MTDLQAYNDIANNHVMAITNDPETCEITSALSSIVFF